MITTRAQNGQPLTWDQMDQNFLELEQGLQQVGQGIADIDAAVAEVNAAKQETLVARDQAVAAASIYDQMNLAFVQLGIAVDALAEQMISFFGPTGADLVNFRQDISGFSYVRSVGANLRDLVNVKNYGAVGDGIHDDTDAIQKFLDTFDSVWFPRPAVSYVLSRPIRVERVVSIDFDPGTIFTAKAGFTGINITKRGQPFLLKSMFAIFKGTNIGNQGSATRLAESGRKLYIGRALLNCAGNADYGLLFNQCPGSKICVDVVGATQFGIWAGAEAWGCHFDHPRIVECTEGGLYLGEASNGAHIDTPEIWGRGIKTKKGIHLEGTPAGTVGAVGNVLVSGGYLEDCEDGTTLTGTGSMVLNSVDLEGMERHAVVADCSDGGVYGQILLNGCTMIALSNAVLNKNAYIRVIGGNVNDGFDLEPYKSVNKFSIFDLDGTLQYTSNGEPAVFPLLTTTASALVNYQVPESAVNINKRTTDIAQDFSRSWYLFNLASNAQPDSITTALEFRSSAVSGSPTSDFRGSFVAYANITTSDPNPRVKKTSGIELVYDNAENAALVPSEDNTVGMGTQAKRWSHVYGIQYHAPGPGGVDAPGVSGTFTTTDGKTVTVRFGIVTGIA